MQMCDILGAGALQVANWEAAKQLAGHLQSCGIRPAEHESVGRALCKLVSKHVSPLAEALYPRGLAGPSILDEEVSALLGYLTSNPEP